MMLHDIHQHYTLIHDSKNNVAAFIINLTPQLNFLSSRIKIPTIIRQKQIYVTPCAMAQS